MTIEASAPVRICDNGGWTDTWFGGPGRVVNIAVMPGVEVSIRATGDAGGVVLDVEDFGDRYSVVPGSERAARHALVEAAIDAFPPPGDTAFEVSIRSAVPAGCGAGTSAAVTVALLGALTATRGEPISPHDAAYAAHRLEVDALGNESGIQDQMSAAFGGINYLEIEPYPETTRSPLPAWDELSARLTLVYLGRAHDSSGLHREVIEGDGRLRSDVFSRLREAAGAARDAVLGRDLHAFGDAMIANTDAQAALHAGLVGIDARRVIDVAGAFGAVGWKVNGAGGDGGSLTLLHESPEAKLAIEHRVAELDARYRVLPVQISPGGLEVRGAL